MTTAQRVIVGEVLASDPFSASTGYLASFRLVGIEVLRGPVPAGGVFEVVELRSGLPTKVCADSFATLLPGDVVVLALDALGPDGVTRINTLAFLRKAGEPNLTAVEDITRAELGVITRIADPPDRLLQWSVVIAIASIVLLGAAAVAIRLRGRAGC